MEFLQQRREEALLENTAQSTLFDFLEKLLPTATEIVVDVPLFGDVDLEILQKCNFKEIGRIIFCQGSITSLKNVPPLKELRVPKNLLVSIPEIKHVEIADFQENGIKEADLKGAVDLKEVYLSRNPLMEISLPGSIEILHVEYCRLNSLHLSNLDHLHTVHCSGNPAIVVHNLPSTVKDFQMDPSSIVETDADQKRRRILGIPKNVADYDSSINAYYAMKQKYETDNHKRRVQLYTKAKTIDAYKKHLETFRPKCANCQQFGGMKFTNDGRTYEAKCNADKPCNFHIKFYAGIYDNLSDTIIALRESTEEKREKIIKLKMDNLFNYLSEEATAKMFKTAYGEYQSSANMLNTYKKMYDDLHFSEERDAKITELNHKIGMIKQEIETRAKELKDGSAALNAGIYKDIIDIHQKELAVEIRNLRMLKFPSMIIHQPDENAERYILDQQRIRLSDTNFTMDEPPKILIFEK